MQHVDEGDLHAWLDGALDQLGEDRAAQVREHLRVCAPCREALVVEETMRARADAVLAIAVPRSIDAPPFETLVERARAVQPQAAPAPARSRLSRVAQMGWAASVVIALGAGWMAREIEVRPKASAELPLQPVARLGAPPAAADAAVGPIIASDAPVDDVARAGASGSMNVAQRSSQSSVSPRVSGVAAPTARGNAEPAAATMEKSAAASGQVASASMPTAQMQPAQMASAEARSEPSAARLETTSSPAPAAPVASRDVSIDPSSAPQMAAESKPAAPPIDATASKPAPRRPTVIVSRRPRADEAAAMAVRSSGVGIPAPAGPDTTTSVPGLFARGRGTDYRQIAGIAKGLVASNDADIDEAVDLIVPDLPVLRVEWTEVSPGRPGLRVLQRLAPGDTLEVRFVRSGGAAADAVADPLAAVVGVPLPVGWSQVVRVHRDGWLVARAPVKTAELEALVDRAGSKAK